MTGHLALVRAGAGALRPGDGLDLRQPDPVRARTRTSPATRATRPAISPSSPASGAHLAYLPTVAEMYPEGASTWVEVEGLSRGLCAERRPHHFRGVATVVTMLLNQAQADVADVRREGLPAAPDRQAAGPRPRHPDRDRRRRHGARARRPRHVVAQPQPDARAPARSPPASTACSRDTAAALADGRLAAPLLAAAGERLLEVGFESVDYVELRDAENLAPLAAAG